VNKFKVGKIYKWSESYYQVVKIVENRVYYELLAKKEGKMTPQPPGKSWFEFESFMWFYSKKESINAEVYRILYG